MYSTHLSGKRIARVTLVALVLLGILATSAAAGGIVQYIGSILSPDQTEGSFFYTVTATGAPNPSHTSFGVGDCYKIIDAGTWSGTVPDAVMKDSGNGHPVIGCDPTTGVCGVKFDEEIMPGQSRNYYFTVKVTADGKVTLGMIEAAIKAGQQIERFPVTGPVCGPNAVSLAGMNAGPATSLPLGLGAALLVLALIAGVGFTLSRRRLTA